MSLKRGRGWGGGEGVRPGGSKSRKKPVARQKGEKVQKKEWGGGGRHVSSRKRKAPYSGRLVWRKDGRKGESEKTRI